jgi:hypothetical protein
MVPPENANPVASSVMSLMGLKIRPKNNSSFNGYFARKSKCILHPSAKIASFFAKTVGFSKVSTR